MRSKILGMAALVAAVFAMGAGRSALSPQAARADDPVVVRAVDNVFSPAEITISAGTTVMWSNEESDPTNSHDVVGNGWYSPLFLPGQTWSFTFTDPGIYGYICDLHDDMSGTVIVQ